jgi:hypothetical protein
MFVSERLLEGGTNVTRVVFKSRPHNRTKNDHRKAGFLSGLLYCTRFAVSMIRHMQQVDLQYAFAWSSLKTIAAVLNLNNAGIQEKLSIGPRHHAEIRDFLLINDCVSSIKAKPSHTNCIEV